MSLQVLKFGGSSLASLECLRHVAQYISTLHMQKQKLIVVVSAMGDFTNTLKSQAESLAKHPSPRELDMLLTAGERISMSLLSIVLGELKVPCVSLTGSQSGILTDGVHGNARIAKITGERIKKNIDANKVVIIAGFQGVDPHTKEVTTLGRGGSDLSSLALAAHFNAESCILFKDVPGVLDGDPRVVPDAKIIPAISSEDLSNLTHFGASIVHSRAAHLSVKLGIPFEVRNSFHPIETGSIVQPRPTQNRIETLKKRPIDNRLAMETPKGVALTQKRNLSFWRVPGLRPEAHPQINKWLWERGEIPLISRCFPDPNNFLCGHWLIQSTFNEDFKKLINTLIPEPTRQQTSFCDVSTVTIVGSGFKQGADFINSIQVLEKKIHPESLVGMDHCDDRLTILIIDLHFKKWVSAIHDLCFKSP